MRGPLHVRSTRTGQVGPEDTVPPGGGWQPVRIIEGEVVQDSVAEGDVVDRA
jgi:hypothetical protein